MTMKAIQNESKSAATKANKPEKKPEIKTGKNKASTKVSQELTGRPVQVFEMMGSAVISVPKAAGILMGAEVVKKKLQEYENWSLTMDLMKGDQIVQVYLPVSFKEVP